MENLSGKVPATLAFPVTNGIPVHYGKTIFGEEATKSIEEVLTDEGSQRNAELGDGTDGG